MKHGLILSFVLLFLVPQISFAQIAKRPLLPEGNLFLDVGNYSAIESGSKARIYGGLGITSGNEKYKDGFDLDTDETGLAGGVDVPVDGSVLSAGVSTSSTEQTETSGGITYEFPSTVTKLVGMYTAAIDDHLVLSAELARVAVEREISASNGVAAISSTADVAYFDLTVGGSFQVTETVIVGAQISPSVSDKKDFTGAFSGIEMREGHGFLLALSGGLNLENIGFGLDWISLGEEVKAGAAKASAYVLTGEFLVADDTSIGGSYFSGSSEPLQENNQYVSAPKDFSAYSLEGRKKFNTLVLTLGYGTTSTKGKDTGDAAFDVDRFDTYDASTFFVRIATDV